MAEEVKEEVAEPVAAIGGEEAIADPQAAEVTQEGDSPVAVTVEVHQDANPDTPAEVKTEEVIREEVLTEVAEREEQNEQWQQLANLQSQVTELNQKLDSLLTQQNPEVTTQEPEAEPIAEEAPNLLEPAEEEEVERKSKKRKNWLW